VLAAEPEHDFSIPAGALSDALAALGRQARMQIGYDPDLVQDLTTPGLSGRFTANEALRRILAGTGLTYRLIDAKTATVISQAESGSGAARMAPVTVLGSRRIGVPISNVPSSISIVDRAQIQKEEATTNQIEDVLTRTVPGFNPTNNGVRQIRGRTAQVFVNGVPVNEQLRASSGSDLNLVGLDQIEDIEVSRGANAAYGFGAPGGIIALSTPRAKSETLTFNTIVRESFNTNHAGGSHKTSLYQSASQIRGAFDFHLGGMIGYDGLEYDPDGNLALGFDDSALITNSAAVLGKVDGSFGLDLKQAGRIRLTGTYDYTDFYKRYSLSPGVYREMYGMLVQEPNGNNAYREAYTVNLGYEHDDVLGNSVKLEAFTSHVDTEVFDTFGADTFRDEQTNEYYGVRSAVTTPLDVILADSGVTYGVDFLRNRYFRPYYNDDTGEISTYFSPDVTLDSLAFYGQLDVPIGDFRLTGGIRHERYSGHAETAVGSGGITGGDIDPFHLTLFNAGIVYFLNENVDIYGTFSQGAEITQLGRAARSASSADQIDPQPAKSDQYELGLRGDWREFKGTIAGFYTTSDLLSALQCDGVNPCTPLREPRKIWGVEGTADWRITEQWGVSGVIAWQDGIRETELDGTRRISSSEVPPILATGNLDYSPFKWWRNTFQINYRHKRDPFDGSTAFDEGRVDSVVLLNLSAAFDVGPGTLRLGVRNLLNTEYTSIPAEAGNHGFLWVPEGGRRVFIAYAVTW
jgi:iron complex outermembrane receptor protein